MAGYGGWHRDFAHRWPAWRFDAGGPQSAAIPARSFPAQVCGSTIWRSPAYCNVRILRPEIDAALTGQAISRPPLCFAVTARKIPCVAALANSSGMRLTITVNGPAGAVKIFSASPSPKARGNRCSTCRWCAASWGEVPVTNGVPWGIRIMRLKVMVPSGCSVAVPRYVTCPVSQPMTAPDCTVNTPTPSPVEPQ